MEYQNSNFTNDNLISHESFLICDTYNSNNSYIQNYHITDYDNKTNIISPRYVYDQRHNEKNEYKSKVDVENLNNNLEKYHAFEKLEDKNKIIPIKLSSGKLDHRIYFNNINLESGLKNINRKNVKCCKKKFNSGLFLKENCNNYNKKINDCINFNDEITLDSKCLKQSKYFNNMTKRKITI